MEVAVISETRRLAKAHTDVRVARMCVAQRIESLEAPLRPVLADGALLSLVQPVEGKTETAQFPCCRQNGIIKFVHKIVPLS